MGTYRCQVCGYIFSEEKEGKILSELDRCPVCGQPADRFLPAKEPEKEGGAALAQGEKGKEESGGLAYDSAFLRTDGADRYLEDIYRREGEG